MIRRKAATLLAVLMIALALGACAGTSDQAPGSDVPPASLASTITIEATEFAFTPSTFTAQVGEEITFEVTNNGTLEHNFVVLDPSGAEVARTSLAVGVTESVLVMPMLAGDYTIVCDIEGHQQAGMQAALTVESVVTR
jgi:uncharacterized cupredoxin-like copper-binding protein